jgi:hypothetical protein
MRGGGREVGVVGKPEDLEVGIRCSGAEESKVGGGG